VPTESSRPAPASDGKLLRCRRQCRSLHRRRRSLRHVGARLRLASPGPLGPDPCSARNALPRGWGEMSHCTLNGVSSRGTVRPLVETNECPRARRRPVLGAVRCQRAEHGRILPPRRGEPAPYERVARNSRRTAVAHRGDHRRARRGCSSPSTLDDEPWQQSRPDLSSLCREAASSSAARAQRTRGVGSACPARRTARTARRRVSGVSASCVGCALGCGH
jgi:hypothetical protein